MNLLVASKTILPIKVSYEIQNHVRHATNNVNHVNKIKKFVARSFDAKQLNFYTIHVIIYGISMTFFHTLLLNEVN